MVGVRYIGCGGSGSWLREYLVVSAIRHSKFITTPVTWLLHWATILMRDSMVKTVVLIPCFGNVFVFRRCYDMAFSDSTSRKSIRLDYLGVQFAASVTWRHAVALKPLHRAPGTFTKPPESCTTAQISLHVRHSSKLIISVFPQRLPCRSQLPAFVHALPFCAFGSSGYQTRL